MDRAMLFRAALLLMFSTLASPAAFRATSPAFFVSETDSDEDGLDDETEELLGTNPEAADSDEDGWGDLTEILGGSDPSDPTDFPYEILATGDVAAPTNPALTLKLLELLSSRRMATGTPHGSGNAVAAFKGSDCPGATKAAGCASDEPNLAHECSLGGVAGP